MEQENKKAMKLRPSWKNYILQYLIICTYLIVIFIIDFLGLNARWTKIIYINGAIGTVLTIIRIVIGKYENKNAWKNYIVQYLHILVMIVIIGVVAFDGVNTGWKKYISIVGIVCIITIFIEIMFCRLSESLTLSEDKVFMEKGILEKEIDTADSRKIRTSKVKQNLWQRLVNIGDIYIFSSGDIHDILAHGINNPHEIRDRILSYGRNNPITPGEISKND